MDYIANSEQQQRQMLQEIGVEDVIDLFSSIPKQILLQAPEVDDGLSEWEGMQQIRCLAKKNQAHTYRSYLGAGAYEHHIPAIISSITQKGEFLTSYTPYQPEASQGMLQAIYEFQSAVCAITGLDVANASVYDGASACAESALMALRLQKKRGKIVVANSLHPHYRNVLKQYVQTAEIIEIPTLNGQIDQQAYREQLDDQVAAVILGYPNFFGAIEPVKQLFSLASDVGALSVVVANPLVYGLFSSAKEIGADIAVGDLQPMGIPLSFGGPYVGYMACRQPFVRQLPGRLVGQTIDKEGRKGFVLTLQAREQHIRRDKATSNICSNQNLAALASLIAMLWYGPKGFKKLALTNYQRATFLYRHLIEIPGVEQVSDAPFFHEFAIRFPKPVQTIQSHLEKRGILGGVALEHFYPELTHCLLIAVTETKTESDLLEYVDAVREVCL